MDAKSKTMPPRMYMDFNPLLEWIRGEKLDVALIHVPGFKKEQLKVEIDTQGNICASGERPLDTDGKQWRRFSTNLQIPANCDINKVHAKFENDTLHIFFPKLVSAVIEAAPKPTTTDKHSATAAGVYATGKENKADKTNSQKKKALSAPSESLKPSYDKAEFESLKTNGRSEGVAHGTGGREVELTPVRKKLLMNVAVATLVFLGLGFYLKYKFTKAETR
ncbi:inactive protein RESTRICTED TEV MOVEMENT 2-like [Zingiber officinale]|uniref:inactive protein RESTRICTED TEV MOVEMENT 2-like n=1 Tax=Zingiber officinale TaxID=94328 RepID=UPI001C4AB058|nr:inactive protein RESTRICTED TEV MOVEMENT 2-like [Zingiber officinale]